ncbi:MAG: PASTA domain-containing protein, partial [Propionibacteriales bacterium]|nr:PASTA domain-containing protein [Propionibacteriales bacterium]
EKELKDAGFEKVTAREANSEPVGAKPDEVLTVDPREGDEVTKGTAITFTYASGESSVPDMTGLTASAARKLAKENGFTKVEVTEEVSDETAGQVFRQTPPPDSRRKRTDTITLVVAKARPQPTPTPTEPESSTSSSPTGPTSEPTGSESSGG